VRLTPHPF